MAVTVEEAVLSALRGQVSGNTKLPAPRLIKIYVASNKREFKEERRVLLEVVGPEIQSFYDDRQIEMEFVDMHFGTGGGEAIVDADPYRLDDHLSEVRICMRDSKSVFFLALIGNDAGSFVLPTSIEADVFECVQKNCCPEERNLLQTCYSDQNNDNVFNLLKPTETVRHQEKREWVKTCREMKDVLERTLRKSLSTFPDEVLAQKMRLMLKSALEREVDTALGCSRGDNMMAVFREWSSPSALRDGAQQIKKQLTECLSPDNMQNLTVEGEAAEIDPDTESHEDYLAVFKTTIVEKLRATIDRSLINDPDCIKGRKKTVQEIFHEHSIHLVFVGEHETSKSLLSSAVPERLRSNVMQHYRSGSRHAPHFIYGHHGSGKSSLIAELYGQVVRWFDNAKVHRVIRFASKTPRSAYSLELLRVICQQISIIFNIPEGYLPKDASFDPFYINNWFQNLLKRCEDLPNDVLFLFIDDLHKLNPLDCDIVAALSWLPISLPSNVFLICSTTIPIDALKLTPIQKERFKSSESLFDLSQESNRTTLKRMRQDEAFETYVNRLFREIEGEFGKRGLARLATYLSCTEYGLSETELLELLMPIHNSDALIDSNEGVFNFSTFRAIRNRMKPLIREKLMSGKVLLQWRHDLCAQIAKSRYMDEEARRLAHTELANIFFSQDGEESDETTISHPTDKSPQQQQHLQPTAHEETVSSRPSNMLPWAELSYSVRHVEESWHHLMRSEDTEKLKTIAMCNFDFLLASLQTVSISYLRCLIEHVRCHILDRDIELIYYTIRKSSDVLTRDPMQLGAQVISWLRPISEHDENDNSLLSITVRSATAWCDGYTVPLLVPLSGWLPVPLPSQIRTMTVSGTGQIRTIDLSPSKQHLIIGPKTGDVQLWHIMNNSLVHTFKGHSGPVTCLTVARELSYLITGSEDTSVILWDMRTLTMKQRIWEHIAAVICVTYALNNTYIISGGDDSSIIISSMETGKLVMKIDHHRGPVTAVHVSNASDVLVSSSTDTTVCLWSLENFTLLNTIQLNSPIMNFEISSDSVFLLALCEDNGLYLRALATGTELHSLKGHKSKVRGMCIAQDSQRAIVGCEDTKALIYDMHSGRIIRSLPPNPGSVTAVYCTNDDDFLITVGGNKITFYSFRHEDSFAHLRPKRRKASRHISAQKQQYNVGNVPITCFDISRDSQLAASASGRSVAIWQLNTPEVTTTLNYHSGPVTAVSFSPNGEFVVSGSEDKSVIVVGLTLGLVVTTFKGHGATIHAVVAMMDSRRVLSADRDGVLHVWVADSAAILQTVQGPHKQLAVTNNMKFAVCTNGDNSLRIWSLTREDEKYTVSHSDDITCFVITVDSLYVITGSRDMSLKVWQATGGKLAQVLVGHTDAVTCVAVPVTNKNQVISGSKDSNLIVWDLHTGEELHTLAGHLAQVTCVKISADGTTAVSGSDDKTLIVWETKRGLALTSLQLHVPFTRFDISLECSRILIQLVDSQNFPVICLHNTPASYVKLPTYSAPARDVEDLRPAGPKRPTQRRLLKKEVSLDTYTWQKKYGHLTSSVMMAQVDERLKRRFSVSASMEEISKIAEMKSLASQTSLCPEQAALAQSQHFDQLEALWNKRSPPRRRLNTSVSRQSSLVEDRISSDEDEFQEERADVLAD
ncbi:protein qui-1 isoform X2 [Phlebotomus argentipes]|uniref:protein qui-1 isoform X2 n=1 Tax=Phlebotomus argentipes TaxID=94469 RepID=UPI002892F82A|nr:protein qui-1 isoform X2 [Phlebotomus argentipes]